MDDDTRELLEWARDTEWDGLGNCFACGNWEHEGQGHLSNCRIKNILRKHKHENKKELP